MKNKIVATEFIEERAKCDFDQKQLASLCAGDEQSQYVREKSIQDVLDDPNLWPTHKFYEMTRKEMMETWMKKCCYLWFHKDREFYFKAGVGDGVRSRWSDVH